MAPVTVRKDWWGAQPRGTDSRPPGVTGHSRHAELESPRPANQPGVNRRFTVRRPSRACRRVVLAVAAAYGTPVREARSTRRPLRSSSHPDFLRACRRADARRPPLPCPADAEVPCGDSRLHSRARARSTLSSGTQNIRYWHALEIARSSRTGTVVVPVGHSVLAARCRPERRMLAPASGGGEYVDAPAARGRRPYGRWTRPSGCRLLRRARPEGPAGPRRHRPDGPQDARPSGADGAPCRRRAGTGPRRCSSFGRCGRVTPLGGRMAAQD